MEGVPRMPMLSVEPKICIAPAEFNQKLKEYIVRHYQEDPEKYDKAIEELDNLRENACTKCSVDISGCKMLKKYFAQLHMMKSRFPMEQGDECAVPFSWLDKFFDMPNPVTLEDIRFEMACIMHNIGAFHSSVGAVDTRMSAEGMKSSCTHFQCAAWAFQYLKDKMNAGSFSTDFDKSILSWYSILMLAQAQECILEKSMVDNRKNTIVAKVSIQIAEYYKQCIVLIDSAAISDLVGNSKAKTWKKLCQLKENYYCGIAYLFMGQAAHEQQKMGERLAWYTEAGKKLEEANKLAVKESTTIKEPLKFTTDVITVKKDNAKKENAFVYHDKVPALDSFGELKGVALVKGIEFNPLDSEISGPDIFGALVPLSVHQSNSMYSEEKAKLLREIGQQVAEKDSELESYMSSLQLDRLSLGKEFSQMPIPEALLERSATFNYELDPVPSLMDSLQRVTGCYQEADSKLLDLEQRLNDSENEIRGVQSKLAKNEMESLMGNLLPQLEKLNSELNGYRWAHQQATQTNTGLHKAVADHSVNLNTLALPLLELKKTLPAPATEPNGSAETEALKKLLDKVEEMKTQRKLLMDQLRDQVHNDDLTRVILSEKDKEPEEIFQKELKKHDEKLGILHQNLAAQANILKALTDANAKYAELRRQTNEAVKARDSKIKGLIAAYDTYVYVKEKSEQGRQFYEKLLTGLNEFDDKLESLEEQWKQAKEKMKRQFREEEERRIAEENVSMPPVSMPSQSSPKGGREGQAAMERAKGERLKDYLEYYRAKKMGGNPAPPLSSGEYGAALNQGVSGSYPPGPSPINDQGSRNTEAAPGPTPQPQGPMNGFHGFSGNPAASIPCSAGNHPVVSNYNDPVGYQGGASATGQHFSAPRTQQQSHFPSVSLTNQQMPPATMYQGTLAPSAAYQPTADVTGRIAGVGVAQSGAQHADQRFAVSMIPNSQFQNSHPMTLNSGGQQQQQSQQIFQSSGYQPVSQSGFLVSQNGNIQPNYGPGMTSAGGLGQPQYTGQIIQRHIPPGSQAANSAFPSLNQIPASGGYTPVRSQTMGGNTAAYGQSNTLSSQQNGYQIHRMGQPASPCPQPLQQGYGNQNPVCQTVRPGLQQNPVYGMQPIQQQNTMRFQQPFGGIDAPLEGSGVSLPAPLQPQKAAVKELTQTEKDLADVFG